MPYFRTDALRDLGAWDPDNVTEDADLGLRLARAGKRAVVFDSTTHEEATMRARQWMRQRSRWIKGFMLTWAVHMRHPGRMMRELGWRSALAINIMLLDGFLSFLMQPFILMTLIAVLFVDAPPWLGIMNTGAMRALTGALIIGQLALLIAAAIAGSRRFGWRSALAVPLLWPYWMAGGIAAVRALVQLITRPQFWEKTTHGISPVAMARRRDALRRGPHRRN